MSTYKSKSWVYYSPGKIKLEERDITCGKTDIMVKVSICGRCGTDVKIFKEGHPWIKPPAIMGHEFVGQIVEIGSEVKNLKEGISCKDGTLLDKEYLDFQIGQRVTVQPRLARYKDGLMLMKDPIGNLSFDIPGAFVEYLFDAEEATSETIPVRCERLTPLCGHESVKNTVIPAEAGIQRTKPTEVESGYRPAPA